MEKEKTRSQEFAQIHATMGHPQLTVGCLHK